jgi:hypothetical protein
VTNLKQGSTDPNSAWAIACYGWVTHLLVRLGLLTLYGPWLGGHQPDYLNREKLMPIPVDDGVGSWDEVHQKVNPGGGIAGGAKDSILQFPCDSNGKLVNGIYDDALVTQMKRKYTDEV